MKFILILIIILASVSCANSSRKKSCDFISSDITREIQMAENARERIKMDFLPRDIQLLEEKMTLNELHLRKSRSELSNGVADADLISSIAELEEKVTKLRKNFKNDLDKRRNEEFRIIQKHIVEKILEYAKLNNIEIIASEGGIVYSKLSQDVKCKRNIDITSSFLKWLETVE